MNADRILSRFLGAVEGPVGPHDQFETPHILVMIGNTDADRDPSFKPERRDLAPQSFGHDPGPEDSFLRKNQRKLIPAITTDHIDDTEIVFKRIGHLLQ